MGGDEYTAKMDQQLPEATILLFRRLAHAKVCSTTCSVIVVLHRKYCCVGAGSDPCPVHKHSRFVNL